MADSKVYWMDAHSESTETSLIAKMVTVFNAAKLDEMIKPNDVVAIKIHCGEWNNSAYLRPVYARALRRPHQGTRRQAVRLRHHDLYLFAIRLALQPA